MIDAITYALLKGDIGQGTQEAVTEYLDEHLTNPSNPPIDTSLEISGAAADSKTTGDKITQLKEDLEESIGTVVYTETRMLPNSDYYTGSIKGSIGEELTINSSAKSYCYVQALVTPFASMSVQSFQSQSTTYPYYVYIVDHAGKIIGTHCARTGTAGKVTDNFTLTGEAYKIYVMSTEQIPAHVVIEQTISGTKLNNIDGMLSPLGNVTKSTNILPDVVSEGMSIMPTGDARKFEIVENVNYDLSTKIPVIYGSTFTSYGVYRIGLFAADDSPLGYLNLNDGDTHTWTINTDTFTQFSTKALLSYMRCVLFKNLEGTRINEGSALLAYEPYYYGFSTVVNNTLAIKSMEPFYATYETIEVPQTITDKITSRLSLVATKNYNYFSSQNPPIEMPQDKGYLYLDESTNKFYYSAVKYDNPEYLFTWNSDIVNGDNPNQWISIITPDGDIIFVTQGKEYRRVKPVIYPHGDYNNPVRPELTQEVLPSGLTTGTGACVSTYGDFILFAEYVGNGHSELNGMPMRIWKVSKPYVNPANWKVVLTKYYSNTGDPWGQDPNNEITHWHTVDYDPYTGFFYANSGDLSPFCRVFESQDNGESWSEVASDGQKWRTLGYIFTEEYCYWATDASFPDHNVYRAPRNSSGGIDFNNAEAIAQCRYVTGSNNHQRTYNLCLTRNPSGLLLLDRAEPRSDKILNLEFYSFDDEKLHLIDVLHSTEGDEVRYGFGNEATTCYQSICEDGIITGSSSYDRKMSVDILNNNSQNRLGVCKIKINRLI